MTIAKTLIRKDVINEFGNKLDDMLEACERTAYGHTGGKAALVQAIKVINALCLEVDHDIESGRFEEAMEAGTLKMAEYVKRWILRAGGSCENLATKEEVQMVLAQGRAEGLRAALKYAKDEHVRAEEQLKRYNAVIAAGGSVEDAERPAMSAQEDLEARRAEAKKAKEQGVTLTLVEDPPEQASEPDESTPEGDEEPDTEDAETKKKPKKKRPAKE